MAILGVETLEYGVEDVAQSTRFFVDFGLPLVESAADASRFELAEGSSVIIRQANDSRLPKSAMQGHGVRRVVWGMDTQANVDRLAADLARDREVTRDADGTAHFLTDFGAAMALRVFPRRAVITAPDAINSPGRINRLNQHRKWRLRAQPKVIGHVVFAVPDYLRAAAFMCERLKFRLSDSQRTFGEYLRAEGSNNHHSILLLNADLHLPGMDGQFRFHHANFGVEDIDEIMVGANHMTRCGWAPSELGLGRHRIDSALFYYLPCPAGGEAEYGTDSDYVDDSWVPREWIDPLFGYSSFVHNLPPFLTKPPEWNVVYKTDIKIVGR
jgi:catechol 2,3-dioxygenase-like lactoylglutathione lyase family enzyme